MIKIGIALFLTIILSSCGPKNINRYKIKVDSQNEIMTSKSASLQRKLFKNKPLEIYENNIPRGVKKTNHPKIFYGQNDVAIIIIHGFIGSPIEASSLGKAFNQRGYTVYMPLIDGFGGSTELANTSDYIDWKNTVNKSIEFLSPHYKKFIIIGFSLGGTIASDFVLNQNNQESYKIESLILLAPFFKPKLWGGGLANSFVSIFTNSVDLATLYKISMNSDILIPLSNPNYYNSSMPLKAVKQMYEFSDEIRFMESSVVSDIPTLLVLTEDDETIDNESSRIFVTKHFTNTEIFQFKGEDNIRHQFVVPEGNKYFTILCNKISIFIKKQL